MCHGREEEGFSLDVKKSRNFTWRLTDQWLPCQTLTTVLNNCAIYSDNPLQLISLDMLSLHMCMHSRSHLQAY